MRVRQMLLPTIMVGATCIATARDTSWRKVLLLGGVASSALYALIAA